MAKKGTLLREMNKQMKNVLFDQRLVILYIIDPSVDFLR